ncbi:MAG: phosphonate ABC transporter ATP-binding protein [Halothiobacillus sp.]|jgi:phosphonate transport system ATP-binding protein|nr:phosphonate ABC transporter ATP-binding protein [Halothiobacillus sp.]
MINLRDVKVEFSGGVTALQSTSLEFRNGEFTVLLGASGAGKSTLLRTLNYLQRPTGGRILVAGLGDLSNVRLLRQHRRATGMIFQQHQLIGRQTALANVLLGRVGYHSTIRSLLPLPRADRQLALECLERVGLLHKALERVDCLSGGQQQRVGIARALVQRPRLMLADEPVASLDPASSNTVLSLLQSICREDGIATIISLHQVEHAKNFADRVIALDQGQVVFDGAPATLTDQLLEKIYHHPISRTDDTTEFTDFPSPVAVY